MRIQFKPYSFLYSIFAFILLFICILCWILLYNSSGVGTAVFGGYRERNFLFNLFITYVTIWNCIFSFFHLSKNKIFAIISIHIGLAITIIILEATALIGIADYRSCIDGYSVGKNLGKNKPDQRVRWTGKPDYFSEGKTYPNLSILLGINADPLAFKIQTDKFGLRNPPGKINPTILLLGDSQIYAGLVPIEKTITERLERLLNLTTLNLAEPRYSPAEELIRLETIGIDVKGKIVLHFIFEGNDLSDICTWRKWLKRRFKSEWPHSGFIKNLLKFLHSPKPHNADKRFGMYRNHSGVEKKIYFLYSAKNVSDKMTEFPYLKSILKNAKQRIESNGGIYSILFIPSKISVLYKYCKWPKESIFQSSVMAKSPLSKALMKFCKELDIQYFDLAEPLEKSTKGGNSPYFPADTHLNSAGHEAIANYLAPCIEKMVKTQ